MSTATAPLAPETLELLQRVSTDTITGLLMKIAGMRTRAVRNVRPMNPEHCRCIGPAFTIRYVPIREDYTDRMAGWTRFPPAAF
jgi:regulator of RNase E activity RraA